MNREDFYRTVSQCLTVDYCNGWNAAVDRIFDENKAKWNEEGNYRTIYRCSKCGKVETYRANYCPSCGCYMWE